MLDMGEAVLAAGQREVMKRCHAAVTELAKAFDGETDRAAAHLLDVSRMAALQQLDDGVQTLVLPPSALGSLERTPLRAVRD